jgi:hypothetical protein
VLLCSALAVCGCSRTDSADARAPEEGAGTNAGAKEEPNEAAREPRLAGPAPGSPEATVRSVLDGLRNNGPVVLWESLPASYRRDLNDLVHEFAAEMDPQVWERMFATASRLLEVLRAKKDLSVPWLAQLPPVRAAGPTNEEDLSAAYDELLRMLALVIESEIGDLEQLKTIDVGRYIERTGTAFMEQMSDWSRLSPDDPFQNEFKQWLADVKIAPVSRQGDKAVLKITAADALGEPIERDWEFVRIEGKWVPAAWAAVWDERIAEARQTLERFASETVAQSKPVVLRRLDEVNAVLGELEGAQTPGEFQLLMAEKVVAPMMLAVQGTAAKPTPARSPANETSSAEVVIRGELTSEIRGELQRKLSEAGDAIVGVPRVGDGEVRFQVVPIGDVEDYARKLDFLRVIKVDRQKRVVTAEVAE